VQQQGSTIHEGSSWGTSWSANDTIVLNLSYPETKKLLCASVSQTNDFNFLSSKATGSIIMNDNKSQGKFVMQGTPCSPTMPSPSNNGLNAGNSLSPVKQIKTTASKNDCTKACSEMNSSETIENKQIGIVGYTMESITH